MSPILRQILQEWIDWVEDGAMVAGPSSTRYRGESAHPVIPDRDTGLCFFASQRGSQLRDEQFCNGQIVSGEYPKHELSDLFAEDGLDLNYPFNANMEEYDEATQLGTHHRNQRRIAWVLAALKAS